MLGEKETPAASTAYAWRSIFGKQNSGSPDNYSHFDVFFAEPREETVAMKDAAALHWNDQIGVPAVATNKICFVINSW